VRKRELLLILLRAMLPGCATAQSQDPAQVVEIYLHAKVSKDSDLIRQLLCAEMESTWESEMHTFDTLSGVSIQDMQCQSFEQNHVVQCQGRIVAVYGGEQRIFPLGSYRVVKENGEWKWCGEAR